MPVFRVRQITFGMDDRRILSGQCVLTGSVAFCAFGRFGGLQGDDARLQNVRRRRITRRRDGMASAFPAGIASDAMPSLRR